MESLPPPKQEEISLPFDVQEKDDCAFRSHTEYAVNQAVWDADNQSVMGGTEEESPHQIFVDPILEYMEVLMDSNSQAWIICKSQIH